jgi:hypothetical protein
MARKKAQASGPNEYTWVILDHKKLVAFYLGRVTTELVERAVTHDYSKFSAEEFGPYEANLPRFKAAVYGSDEYKACCKAIEPAIQHHFEANRHHPEHFGESGIDGMNLLDVMEMVCDWIAAAKRVPGGKLRLDLQRERFHISDQLFGLIARTVESLTADEGDPHER